MRPRRNQITYDYLITNDAEWTTVFGLGAATLSGKTIAVAPGNYTSKTISSFNPAATVRVISSSASSKPRIDQLNINGSSRLSVENLELVNSQWSATAASSGCLQFANAVSDISVLRCDFVGNYRGTVGFAIDPTIDTYPEYACVLPIFNSSGVVTGFSVTRPNVGDLLADGTYSMVFNNYSSITFTVAPVATFTVAGGVITGTTLTSGGSSNASDTTGAGIRSALITWAGQRPMASWLPSGWRCSGSAVVTGTITFRDNTFKYLNSSLKPVGLSASTNLVIERNTFDVFYSDCISFGGLNPCVIRDNFATRPFHNGDAGDAHTDFVQLIHSGAGNWSGVVVERNVFATGNARGAMQGVFVADASTGSYVNPRIVGNAVLTTGSIQGLAVSRPADGFVYANTFARFDPTNPRNTNALQSSIDTPSGDVFLSANIIEDGSVSGSNLFNNGVANTVLGLNGATIAYGDVFSNHTGAKTTLAEIASAFSVKLAYAGRGAFGNRAYIDHVNRTTNLSLEPTVCRFTSLTAQTVSTLVTGEWSRIMGGPETGSISVAGGEYRFADDAIGTNATAWTSAAGTYTRDKFVQPRHTTSATGTTDTTTTLTFRGSHTASFTSTTASVSSFSLVDNQITAWSRFANTGLTETGVRKIAIAFRIKLDAVTSGVTIFGNNGTTRLRFYLASASAYRFDLSSTSRCQLRPVLTPDTNARTFFITLDLTNTNASQGCYLATDLEGVILNNTPGTGGGFDTRSTPGTGTDWGSWAITNTGASNSMFGLTSQFLGMFDLGDGTGTRMEGAFSFFWMDWGSSSYTLPDITDSAVRNKWTADLIDLSDGSGPTGTQPKIFYTGNAAGWNAGLSNLGSLTLPLDKQAGTYV